MLVTLVCDTTNKFYNSRNAFISNNTKNGQCIFTIQGSFKTNVISIKQI